MNNKIKNIVAISASAVLLLAIPSIWPYGFFEVLRWVVAGSAAYMAYSAHTISRNVWMLLMIFIVILFNPIAPIHLTKDIWVVIDTAVAGIFIISIFKLKSKQP